MALVLALLLVTVMGVAIQRGNTCCVVAIDEIANRRTSNVAAGIGQAWLWVAGGLTVANLTFGLEFNASVVRVSAWSVIGGLMLGIGAAVNGACMVGTVARVGAGAWPYLTALPGFVLGAAIAPYLLGTTATTHELTLATTTTITRPWIGLSALAVVLVLTARRLYLAERTSIATLVRSAWNPRTATAVIGLLFVALVHVYGAWAYTDLLGELARGEVAGALGRALLLLGLFGGAVIGGLTQTGSRPVGPLAPQALRSLIGGAIMGIGFTLIPGSSDGLTLVGQSLALPFAWVAMVSAYAGVLAGVVFLRSGVSLRFASLRRPA